MNFVGHVAVAIEVEAAARSGESTPPASRAFLVGAVLPDLAAMGRFRLLGRPDTGDTDGVELARGIDLHHRTDEAFHHHRWFRNHSGAVTAALGRAGLPRGAARACGHVGIELLLDGHLLADRPDLLASVASAVEGIGHHLDRLEPLVSESQRPGWCQHIDRLSRWTVPDDYRQPAAVAARLQRILARRPRLAFPPAQISTVAATLTDHHEDLASGAGSLLSDLTDHLTPGR